MHALILVDFQNDFLPGGALPVPDADALVPLVNRLTRRFDLGERAGPESGGRRRR